MSKKTIYDANGKPVSTGGQITRNSQAIGKLLTDVAHLVRGLNLLELLIIDACFDGDREKARIAIDRVIEESKKEVAKTVDETPQNATEEDEDEAKG